MNVAGILKIFMYRVSSISLIKTLEMHNIPGN
jgi:hypothetical protein